MRHGEVDAERQIAAVVRRLTTGPERRDTATLEAAVRHCFAEWNDAPVRDFVPILVERRVRQELGLASNAEMAGEAVAAS